MRDQGSGPLPRDQAEALAVRVLAWMAADPDLIGGFLAATGGDVADLRARAAEPEFLGFVLDFLLADDALVIAWAAQAGVPPDRPARARAALPGGDLPNWT